MKKYFAALSTTVLITMVPYALAASSTDLTVTGTITPQACMPNLSNGGVVDYGKISSKDLNLTSETSLDYHTLTLGVNCASSTLLALQLIDNRNGSSSSSASWTFGMGLINGTQKLGYYSLFINTAVADGVPAQTISSKDNGATWNNYLMLASGDYLSVAASNDWTKPIAVKDLNMHLNVLPRIARADSLDLTHEVAMDGSATLEMKYL
ncbi:DUF1120 domain-containing protein [Pseudomonas putida]|uniref:DUF1120 domain-containing protein n=1 Tax=Pseudomonas putida TaxID=303 RepID=UPI003D9748CB